MTVDTKIQAVIAGYITYEQYLKDERENHKTEWVDGKVITTPMVSEEHNALSGFLLLLLQIWVEEHRAGTCYYEVFNMKTGPNLPGRSPDVMFVASANLWRLRPNHLEGPCDIAVEVVSPEYRRVDTEEKFREYAQGGVPEYWIVDQAIQHARFYSLNANGEYEEIPLETGEDGRSIFRSRILPGFWLDMEWLWQRPTPTPRALLHAWNLL